MNDDRHSTIIRHLWAVRISGYRPSSSQRHLVRFCLSSLLINSDINRDDEVVIATSLAKSIGSISHLLDQMAHSENDYLRAELKSVLNNRDERDDKNYVTIRKSQFQSLHHLLLLIPILTTQNQLLRYSLLELLDSALSLLNVSSKGRTEERGDEMMMNDDDPKFVIEWNLELACCLLICDVLDCISKLRGPPIQILNEEKAGDTIGSNKIDFKKIFKFFDSYLTDKWVYEHRFHQTLFSDLQSSIVQ